MVVVKLYGGLGNQLFQYSFGYALAKKMKTTLYLDISWYSKKFNRATPRKYELDSFHITSIPKSKIIDFTLRLYNDPILKRLPLPRKLKIIKEKNYSFINLLATLKESNVYLDGYWQSYKYYEVYNDLLVKDFLINRKILKLNFEILNLIKYNPNSVSLHIRRTDYTHNSVYQQCDFTYYKNAINEINKKIDNPFYFIFSDDIEFVKNNFIFEQKTIFVEFDKSFIFKDIYSFHLMSLCRHNIIANSTFSWWAAWLNSNKNKIIISPKKWFQNENLSTIDLIPREWIQI